MNVWKKGFYILSLGIALLGLLLYFILKNIYFLFLVIIGLSAAAFLKYEKIKKDDEKNYLNMRLVFMYLIGASFTIFVFVVSLLKQK